MMFLIYTIFGLIGYNIFVWALPDLGSWGLLITGGIVSILFALFLIGAICGNAVEEV